MNETIFAVKIMADHESCSILDELLISTGLLPSVCLIQDSDIGEIFLYEETEENTEKLKEQIVNNISEWNCFATFNIREITTQKLIKENWAESWKKYFFHEKVSDHVVVKPSWEEYTCGDDEIIVEIDPGMSFGTGAHGTTRGCIKFLDKLYYEGNAGSMLDIGCGSGILSITAAKLGYHPVYAFDNDPDAVEIAAENIKLSKTETLIEPFVQSLDKFKGNGNFNVVAANLQANILIPFASNILSSLKKAKSSRLIISGILNEQYHEVLMVYTSLGMKELEKIVIQEWTTGLLEYQ